MMTDIVEIIIFLGMCAFNMLSLMVTAWGMFELVKSIVTEIREVKSYKC